MDGIYRRRAVGLSEFPGENVKDLSVRNVRLVGRYGREGGFISDVHLISHCDHTTACFTDRSMKFAIALLTTLTIVAATLFAQTSTPPKTPVAMVKNVTPDQAEKALKEHKDIIVLDIRTPDEFKAGHLAGAKNIDFLDDSFAKQVAALDKSKTYLVHCASGGRSGKSLPTFEELKFTSLLHLNDGFKGWEAAGKPVEK